MTITFSYQPSFSPEPVTVKTSFARYMNGSTAINLIDCEDGMPYAVATTCMTNVDLNPDEVTIKNWSENEGILEAMIKAGIISEPIKTIPSGYVQVPVCKLLIKPEYK